jgi:predicted transcriptional regulator
MEETYYKPQIDKAIVNAITKRRYAMILLKFLFDNGDDAFYVSEIARILGLCDVTLKQNLDKLCASGLVRKTNAKSIDKRTKYYSVTDKEIAEKVLQKYYRYVIRKLAKLIPATRTSMDEIKRNDRFAKECRYFGLSVDEAIAQLRNCTMLERESYQGVMFFKRKKVETPPYIEKPEAEKPVAEEIFEG